MRLPPDLLQSRSPAMFRIDAGRVSPKYCDGQSRRSFLQLGVAGMAAVGLPQLLQVQAASAAAGQAKEGHFGHPALARWRAGAPGYVRHEAGGAGRVSRPLDADQDECAGMEVTELFPLQAKIADKFSDRPLAASRYGRPLHRRPLDADRARRCQRREHRLEVILSSARLPRKCSARGSRACRLMSRFRTR